MTTFGDNGLICHVKTNIAFELCDSFCFSWLMFFFLLFWQVSLPWIISCSPLIWLLWHSTMLGFLFWNFGIIFLSFLKSLVFCIVVHISVFNMIINIINFY